MIDDSDNFHALSIGSNGRGSARLADECLCCGRFRRLCWEFLTRNEDARKSLQNAALAFEICMCFLALVLFVSGTLPATSPPDDGGPWTSTQIGFNVLETFLTVVFGIEYILMIFSCIEDEKIRPVEEGRYWRTKARMRKAIEPMMILDLVMIVALAIESQRFNGFATFRVLRVFRILSLLRLEQNFSVLGLVMKVMHNRREELTAALMLAIMMLLTVSSAMFYIEEPYNEMFKTLGEAMWWGTTALTTVGYGDIYPQTVPGKILGSMVAFMGVGMFALPAGILASGFQEVIEARNGSTEPVPASESRDLNITVKQLESQTHELKSDLAKVQLSQQELQASQHLLLLEQRRIADMLEQLMRQGSTRSSKSVQDN